MDHDRDEERDRRRVVHHPRHDPGREHQQRRDPHLRITRQPQHLGADEVRDAGLVKPAAQHEHGRDRDHGGVGEPIDGAGHGDDAGDRQGEEHHERHAVVAYPFRDEEDDSHRDNGEDDDDVGRHCSDLSPDLSPDLWIVDTACARPRAVSVPAWRRRRRPHDDHVRADPGDETLKPSLDAGFGESRQPHEHGFARLAVGHASNLPPHVRRDREQRLRQNRVLEAAPHRVAQDVLGVPHHRVAGERRPPLPRNHRQQQDPADTRRANGRRHVDEARGAGGIADRHEHERAAAAQAGEIGVTRLGARVGETGAGREQYQVERHAEAEPQGDHSPRLGYGDGLEDRQPQAEGRADGRERRRARVA